MSLEPLSDAFRRMICETRDLRQDKATVSMDALEALLDGYDAGPKPSPAIAEMRFLRELAGAVGTITIACASLTPEAHQGATCVSITPAFSGDFQATSFQDVDLCQALEAAHSWLQVERGGIPWRPCDLRGEPMP